MASDSFFSSQPHQRQITPDGQLFHSHVTDESYTQLPMRIRDSFMSCELLICPCSTTSYLPTWRSCQTPSVKIPFFLHIKVNSQCIYFSLAFLLLPPISQNKVNNDSYSSFKSNLPSQDRRSTFENK